MPTPLDITAASLLAACPEQLDFVRWSPYGLVLRRHGDDVSLASAQSYVVLNLPESVELSALLPPLRRLALCVRDGVALRQPDEFTNELIWLFVYGTVFASTNSRTPEGLATPVMRKTWSAIADNLLLHPESVVRNPISSLHAAMLVGLRLVGASSLEGKVPSWAHELWLQATTVADFSSFLTKATSMVPQPLQVAPSQFRVRASAKSRIVVHDVHAEIEGTLATDETPWVPGESGLRELIEFFRSRPIIRDNHEIDEPIGLIYNPHLAQTNGGRKEVHGTLFVVEPKAVDRVSKYRGFSLGVLHDRQR